MKKVLSIVAVALLLILVGCTETAKSNARAYVTSITPKSMQVSFKVEVKDPDAELDHKIFKVRLVTPGEANIEQTLELSTVTTIRTMTFTGLKLDSTYEVFVFGTKEEKEIQLYHMKDVFTTLKEGDESESPITITTTEAFKTMVSSKHYVLGNDLDFSNESMAPLFTSGTPFTGSLDGKGFSIKNINITAENDVYKSYLSVFGYVSRATIKNIKFDNVHIDNEAKPYVGIHYVGLLVSKVSNNAFVLEDIEITNSSITITHNFNKSTTNRNLYVGLVGGSMQGTLRNITVSDSTLTVNQNAVNGTYAGAQAATAGTYIGGAFGLIEQDKGMNIQKIAVIDSEVNYNVEQDKAALGSGLSFVGGIFGAYRSDRNAGELYTNITINIEHTKHENTLEDRLDILYVGGITGSIINSRFNNVFFDGEMSVNASDKLQKVFANLIAGQATASATKVLAGGTFTLTTTNDAQDANQAAIYPYSWSNQAVEVKILDTASITFDGATSDLSEFNTVANVSDHITSEFILDLLS